MGEGVSTRLWDAREVLVPAGLLAIVGCMIIPLPGVVIDILLCCNLLAALLLVVGALHVRDPLKVASLPSLLLMATLFRLGLNVATTRAVLSTGQAGHAVEAFGSIVIQGSVVVGFVLFLLITLIQFIVVAKGAERVAEVSARFTLDAMPGKQMSIDAEIRAGLLDPESARRKRLEVQLESRFYGALDGAMKFVKGDAIAGLVIAAVNICGGLAIGMLVHHLDLEVAVHRYTVLTIGDGLLSQIPSLLNSVAAGLIVTRVQVDESSTLARDLLSQLGQFRVARSFVAVASFVLGCMPGMPHAVLLVVSAAIVLSLVFGGSKKTDTTMGECKPFEPTLSQLIQVELNPEVVPFLPALSDLSTELEGLRQHAFDRWGLVVHRPGVALWPHPIGAYRILVRGMEVFRSGAAASRETWSEARAEVVRVIDSHRLELLDDGATRRALDYVERQIPDLVQGVVPAVMGLTQLTGVLRALLREEVTTRHLDIILQTIAEAGGKLNDRQLLAEIRIALAPVVSAAVATDGVIEGAEVEPLIDLVLGKAEDSGALVSADVVDLICQQIEALHREDVILVASKRARAYLRDIVRTRWSKIRVVAQEEIASRFTLTSVGCIEVPTEEQRRALVATL